MIPNLTSPFESSSPYRRLARSLDALPNGFPPSADEADLRLLAKLFTPEEADLAADLLPDYETFQQIGQRLGRDPRAAAGLLKEMAAKRVIGIGKTEQGRLGFKLMPFVVGFYEAQNGIMDAEFAQLFEDYFRAGFGESLRVDPQVHRVVPVGVSVSNTMEVRPFESVSALVDQALSVGVIDCICRTQKALIGESCGHPVDVCMVLSDQQDAFKEEGSFVRPLTHAEAEQTLRRAAQAGLVHCVSNNQRDLWYICNCCTCSCGVLRGMADLGIANVVARSAFVNRVDAQRCEGCGACLDACAFGAITIDYTAQINETRCVGCGVCVGACPAYALSLERRPGVEDPPLDERAWGLARAAARG